MAIFKSKPLSSIWSDDSIMNSNLGTYHGNPVGQITHDVVRDEYLITGTDGKVRRVPVEMINKNALQSQLQASMMQAAQTVKTTERPLIEMENYRMKVLAMRLRLREGESMPYHFIQTAFSHDKVFVFVVQDGQAVTLEDSAALFPSDTLITQLRLLDK